ncbi:MAG: histidine kinase [Chloroflexi bacterium]|nr:histidine kinase [Chloroflexota bacterium]
MAKVLIVDDEQSLLFLLQQIVEEQGHYVLLAENGEQALHALEKENPDLIITDVMMPIMDGYQLLMEVKTRPELCDTKVVLISAAPINRRFEPKPDAYLTKPYDLVTIEDLLLQLI